MSAHLLEHPNLPDQPIVVNVPDGAELSQEYARAGWVDKGTPPEPVEDDSEAADEVPDAGKSKRPLTTPPVPVAEVAEPTAEQAPAPLDTPKE